MMRQIEIMFNPAKRYFFNLDFENSFFSDKFSKVSGKKFCI